MCDIFEFTTGCLSARHRNENTVLAVYYLEIVTHENPCKVMLIVLLVLIPISILAQPYESEKRDVGNEGTINVLGMFT